MMNECHEFCVFGPDGERFAEPVNNPMSGYSQLAQAINHRSDVSWELLCRTVKTSEWKDSAIAGHIERQVERSPWQKFCLTPTRNGL